VEWGGTDDTIVTVRDVCLSLTMFIFRKLKKPLYRSAIFGHRNANVIRKT
jgi:hypothetical protein